ncbi:MAG: hypothetical protein MUC87_05730 [Bacteroidia bacterium]|jgi:hypothetical protein|nr:hypothetical protein [Bacteroidia bacterium]
MWIYGAFVFTVISEWILFSAFSRYALRITLFFIVLLNLVTWPVISFLYSTTDYPLWLMEIGVCLVETIIITIHWYWKWWRGAAAALLINAGSWGLGSLFEMLFFR